MLVWMGPAENDSSTALLELKRLGSLAMSKDLATLLNVNSDERGDSLDEFLVDTIGTLNGHGQGCT